MSDDTERKSSLLATGRKTPLSRAQTQLTELRDHWAKHGVLPAPPPLSLKDSNLPGRCWLPEPEWTSGGDAFEILRLQAKPYEYAPPIARICEIISDQWDREETGLNYAFACLPPTHPLLADFPLGSTHWFRALNALLRIRDASEIEGWERLEGDLHDWIVIYDFLRIRTRYVVDAALRLDWPYYEYSLPEAKQEPIWHFPKAMAWIATRDYLALARMGVFYRPEQEGDAVADDGVCEHNTRALGWLHTAITFAHCNCGALQEFGLRAFKHCTCISVAWEELVRFRGGLSPETPELVFNLQEGWLSMTWPDGADDIRFLRQDILDRWPARRTQQPEMRATDQSTTAGEQDCRNWLAREFVADPEKRRSKKDFREAALAAFSGRLSERGFNLRVWPDLARKHGRDGAGAKKKS